MPLNIVIAPDSFKESLSAKQVCAAIQQGFRQVFTNAEFHLLPMADGGEGTVEAMVTATAGHYSCVKALDPLGRPISANYGWLGNSDTAIIEVAAASGLHLVEPEQRDAKITSSYGTGQLINDALNHGAKHIILGLGGSATNDAGAGILTALGYRLLDHTMRPVELGGAALLNVACIDDSDVNKNLSHCKFTIAADVDNPLCGPRGASAIFGPQKGASAEDINLLDHALAHFARLIEQHFAVDVATKPGAGAAGGIGATLMAAVGGKLQSGSELVIESINLNQHIEQADLVITGEGRMDGQSIHGKAPVAIAKLAQHHQVPVVAICGSTGDGIKQVYQHGVTAVFSVVNQPQTIQQALTQGHQNIVDTSENIARSIKLAMQLNKKC
ncbi:glycerate kinase [Thalassotalea maritima]|uniref:glycerate kinase n=1 Tax=Thalassotalea maritima TaxID=3242416 RepID=UPI003528628A